MTTGAAIAGRLVEMGIGWKPDPGMSNAIMSRPKWALASVIAWWSDPAPVSAVLVTVKVSARAAAAHREPARAARTAIGCRETGAARRNGAAEVGSWQICEGMTSSSVIEQYGKSEARFSSAPL